MIEEIKFNSHILLNNFCKINNISHPKYKIIDENLKSVDAQIKEKYWIDYYKNNGWYMFNLSVAGSLGGHVKMWTKNKLQKIANEVQTRKEFYDKNKKAYNAASEYKLLNELFKNHPNNGHTKDRNHLGYWTKEKLQEEVNKNTTRKEFREKYKKVYNMAKEYKLLDELFKNHINNGYLR